MINYKQQSKDFFSQLSKLDLDNIRMPSFTKDYLKNLLKQQTYFIDVFAFVVKNAIENTNFTPNEIRLLDFGAGNGLVSFFAKFCGIQHVVVCDVRPAFIEAIKQLSIHLDIYIDDYIIGDEQHVLKYYQKETNKPNICIGTDVIEHVYSVEKLILILREINPSITLVFSTASVFDNWFKKQTLYKLMYKDEHIGYNTFGDNEDGNLFAGQPFFAVRSQIIQKHEPSFTTAQVNHLALCTRGLHQKDIIKTIDKYKKTNIYPPKPLHKYNTCNPITSSFTEQMITHLQYKNIFTASNYTFKSVNGFYNTYNTLLKKAFYTLANIWLNYFKINYLGRIIAPFVVLISKPK